jgi:hypothetical protein
MDLLIVQEFLAVLLALAVLTGTILVLGVGLVLFQEGIGRVLHGRRTPVVSPKGASANDVWFQDHGRSMLR